MELVRFKARCRKCHAKLRITLDQARADQNIVCSRGHLINAREAIESELVNGVNRGSLYYFECLVYIFDREVKTIIRRRLENWLGAALAEEETKDAVQQLYLDLWRKKIGRIDKSLTGYIRGIAYRKGIDRMRERGDVFTKSLSDDDFSAVISEIAVDPLPTLERNDLLRLVNEAISKLPADHQKVLVLRYMEGYSEDEAARCLKIAKGTVKSRLNRAVKALREFISSATALRSVD